MAYTRDQLEAMVKSVPFWFHSIDLGQGVITPGDHQTGAKSAAHLAEELAKLRLPDLRGKSVLDIGAWDGFYSFEAERRGARRVVALDHYVWSCDLPEHIKHWSECMARNAIPEPFHTMPYWRPAELPGKRGFDTAHKALDSKVEAVVADFMDADLGALGAFDVVFYLGVLYHMEDPLRALKRVAAVTREVAVIETEAVLLPAYEHMAVCEFFESNELFGDVSNWWSPNLKALGGLCRAAGFKRVEVVAGPGAVPAPIPDGFAKRVKDSASYVFSGSLLKKFGLAPAAGAVIGPAARHVGRYRAVVHAWK